MSLDTSEYYDTAIYADDELLRGSGVIGLISGDQLHPPMVDDPEIWSNSRRWQQGGEESVRRLLKRAAIRPADLVLDVGCGIGGATRMVGREFGGHAIGLNISEQQLRTARKWSSAESYVKATAEQIPLASRSVHCVLTVNMFYHVGDKRAALREMFRVTTSGGKLAFDDWVVTDRASDADRAQLLEHWNPEPTPWITDRELGTVISDVGYEIQSIEDYASVGRGVMAEHFAPTFEREVRALIVRHDPLHGQLVADHLRAAIDHTIRLYIEGKMRYLQIIARKP
jgi:ubiquinone/menaquinone biosynthesis C-methylase UbiE